MIPYVVCVYYYIAVVTPERLNKDPDVPILKGDFAWVKRSIGLVYVITNGDDSSGLFTPSLEGGPANVAFLRGGLRYGLSLPIDTSHLLFVARQCHYRFIVENGKRVAQPLSGEPGIPAHETGQGDASYVGRLDCSQLLMGDVPKPSP